MNVLIVGAHPEPSRFAHKAMKLLAVHGHETFCVNPKFKDIESKPCYASVGDWQKHNPHPIDTVTMYVGAALSTKMKADLLNLKPRRVIFNPGSENPALSESLERAGINCIEDCTLVMLGSQTF